jgi:hypothetical protein
MTASIDKLLVKLSEVGHNLVHFTLILAIQKS